MVRKKIDVTKSTSTRYLKKQGKNEWFDPTSGQLFYKEKGELKMKIDPFEKKMHNEIMANLRRQEKKWGISTKKEREMESKRWKNYTKAIKEFNEGSISRASTVARRRRAWGVKRSEEFRYWNQPKEKMEKIIKDKKAVMLMRISGKRGVYNAEYYNTLIKKVAEYSKLDIETVEQLLFPKGLEESSKYEDIKDDLDNGFYSFIDAIDNQLKKGLISQNDYKVASDLADFGMNIDLNEV